MKFSMEEFAGQFQEDYKEYEKIRNEIDTSLIYLSQLDNDFTSIITEIQGIWYNYKNMVGDVVLSASMTRNYMMAADIVTLDGVEIGAELTKRFELLTINLNNETEIVHTSTNELVNLTFIVSIIGMIIGSIVLLIFVFYSAPYISKPINYLKNVITDFAKGDYNTEIAINTKDEIGELTDQLRNLKVAQLEKIKAAQRIASGIIERVELASDKDELGLAFNKKVETLNSLIKEAKRLIEANENGDLNLRGDVNCFSGVWGDLIKGINSILNAATAPVNLQELVGKFHIAKEQTKQNKDYKDGYSVRQN